MYWKKNDDVIALLLYNQLQLRLDDEAPLSDFVDDQALHDAPCHSRHDERSAHVVWAVGMSPEKLDLHNKDCRSL